MLRVLCIDGELPRVRVSVLMESQYWSRMLQERPAEDVSAEVLNTDATLAMFRCVYESLAFGAVVTPCCNAEAVLRYYRAEMDDAAVVVAVGDAVAAIGAGAAAVVPPPAPPGSQTFGDVESAIAACAPAMVLFMQLDLKKIKHSVHIEMYTRGLFGELSFTVPAKSRMVALFSCNVPAIKFGSEPTCWLSHTNLEGKQWVSRGINQTAFMRNHPSAVTYTNVFESIEPGWIMLVYAL